MLIVTLICIHSTLSDVCVWLPPGHLGTFNPLPTKTQLIFNPLWLTYANNKKMRKRKNQILISTLYLLAAGNPCIMPQTLVSKSQPPTP